MRLAIILAVSALALGACGKKGEEVANVGADQSLSAQNITTNDITAIDAVTGESANMAADMPVDEGVGNLENDANSIASSPEPGSKKPSSATKTRSATAKPPAATTNSGAPAPAATPTPAPSPTGNTAQ